MKKYLVAVLWLLLPSYALAEGGTVSEFLMPEEVKQYKARYEEITKSGERQSLSELFQMGEKARRIFSDYNNPETICFAMTGEVPDEEPVRDEQYYKKKEDFFKKIAQQAPGYKMKKDSCHGYYVDADKFLKLAQEHGLPEDIAFFELYRKTFPDGQGWPDYINNWSGCRYYTNMAIGYESWSKLFEQLEDPFYKKFAKAQSGYVYHTTKYDIMPYTTEPGNKVSSICSCESREKTLVALRKISQFDFMDPGLRVNYEKTLRSVEKNSISTHGKYRFKNLFDGNCAQDGYLNEVKMGYEVRK